MSELIDDLYREQLLDLAAEVKQMAPLVDFTSEVTKYNAVCGDKVLVQIKMNQLKIADVSVSVRGCVICAASAGIMCYAVKNRSEKTVRVTIKNATRSIADGKNSDDRNAELDLLCTVSQFPNRVRCAMLAWEALDEAIGKNQL